MARWQDELRRLVDERADELVDAAGGDVAAVEDALVDVYTGYAPHPRPVRGPARGRLPRGSSSTVELAVDDELDGPTALVTASLARAADRAAARASGAAEAGPPPDGPADEGPADEGPADDYPAVDVASVEARVVRARRRRTVAGWSTAGVAAAAAVGLAVVLFTGPTGAEPASHDRPRTADPVAAAPCGTSSGESPSPRASGAGSGGHGVATFAVSLTSQTGALTPEAAWVGIISATATGPDDAAVDLGRLAPLPLLVRDGLVVAAAARPGSRLADGPSFAAAPFVPCAGVSLRPGAYTVVVDQPVLVGDAEYRVVSNAVPVRVVTAQPHGYRPAWLAGSPLACGSTIDEVGVRADGATPAQLELDRIDADAHGLTVSFLNTGTTTVTYTGNQELALMWVRDGVVRSVGHDLSASDGTVRVPGQTTLRLSARWDTTDYCEPARSAPTYPHHLPAGTYEAYAYARTTAPSHVPGAEAWFVQTTGATVVRVGADGAVLGR